MEKLRKFERSCLRACLHTYREDSNKHFISNQKIYDKANIPRIDNHILKLTCDYLANLKKIDNRYLQLYINTIEHEVIRNSATQYILPHSFMYLDKRGLIQNDKNVPLLYHISRHQGNKKIPLVCPNNPAYFKYSQAMPQSDTKSNYKSANKYWWLGSDSVKNDDIHRRARRKNDVQATL